MLTSFVRFYTLCDLVPILQRESDSAVAFPAHVPSHLGPLQQLDIVGRGRKAYGSYYSCNAISPPYLRSGAHGRLS